jgi:hypothetical protein
MLRDFRVPSWSDLKTVFTRAESVAGALSGIETAIRKVEEAAAHNNARVDHYIGEESKAWVAASEARKKYIAHADEFQRANRVASRLKELIA